MNRTEELTTKFRTLSYDHERLMSMHRDANEKAYNVSDLIRRAVGIPTVKREIAKCDVLCVRCHRLRTAAQFGWYANVIR